MFIATVILAVLLGAAFIAFGAGKLMGAAPMVEARQHLGLADGLFKAIGGLEVLGGAGVLIGLHNDLPIIGVLAALGLIGMTVGAAFYHQKAGDAMKEWIRPWSWVRSPSSTSSCESARRSSLSSLGLR